MTPNPIRFGTSAWYAAVIAALKADAEEASRSPEIARKRLMATGMYHPDGRLKAEWGGDEN